MDIIMVYCTVPNKKLAHQIAKALVKNKVAACVNVTPNVESFFYWEGELCKEKEFLLTIKTRRELFKKVKLAIETLHDYTTPEIIAVPVVECGKRYAKWIESVTEPSQK